MAIFDWFPYTNIHEMNLDWIVKLCKSLDLDLDKFKAKTTEDIKNLDLEINALRKRIDESELPEVVKEQLREMADSGELGELIQQAILDINDEVKYHIGYGGTVSNPTGAGFWVETDNSAIVSDLGVYTENITNSIKDVQITDIKAIIISHYHEDHTGDSDNDGTVEGLVNFLNDSYFNFDDCKAYLPHHNIIWGNMIPNAEYFLIAQQREQNIITALQSKGIEIVYPVENQEVTIGSIKLTFNNLSSGYFAEYYNVTAPDSENTDRTIYNNFSMITSFKHVKKAIYSADIEFKAQEKNYRIYNNCDIFFAPHHGLNETLDRNYLNNVQGEIAIIPTGYRHYDIKNYMKSDVHKLIQQGAVPFYTVDAGNIIIKDSIYGLTYEVSGDIIEASSMSMENSFGYMLQPGDNIDDFNYPSIWSVQNYEVAQEVIAQPSNERPFTSGGYRGETIVAKGSRGLIQRALLSWNQYQTEAKRSWFQGDKDNPPRWNFWRYVNYVKDSIVRSYANIAPNTWLEGRALEIDNIINENFKRYQGDTVDSFRQNYVTFYNGILSIGIDVKTKNNISGSTRIFTWQATDGAVRVGGYGYIFDENKTPYRIRVTYSGNERYVVVEGTIPADTRLTGSITLTALP